jgi:hypothetical protein
MEKGINFHGNPQLDKPDFIAAWPAMGNVALKVTCFLKDKLKVEEFAEIEKYIRQIREETQVERMLSKEEEDPGYVH